MTAGVTKDALKKSEKLNPAEKSADNGDMKLSVIKKTIGLLRNCVSLAQGSPCGGLSKGPRPLTPFKKSKFASSLIFIFIPLTLLGLARSTTEVIVITDFPEKYFTNISKKTLPDGTTAYGVSDINYAESADPLSTDLLLKFDREPMKYLKDDSGKYEIYSADYNFISKSDGIGRGCASFFKSGHCVYINTSEGLWLGSIDDLGSFNIEFRFKPLQTSGGVLFARTGYLSGMKKGIEITLRNGRVIASLHNMFRMPDGKLRSAVLGGGDSVTANKWHHFSLSFDRSSGRLAKFMDGDEDGVTYMTDTGTPEGHVFVPMFGHIDETDDSVKGTDLPLAVIGKNYNGLMDEFRISYSDFDSLKNSKDVVMSRHKGVSHSGRLPYNREGVITGDVGRFPTTGTSITDFSWDEVSAEGTFVWMEIRTSDKTFDARDRNLRWFRVSNSQKGIYRVKGEDSEFLKGKYYQWRAHLVASPEGSNSPLLKKITIKYRADTPPDVPVLVEVAEAGDRYVVLRWKKNVEHDMLGYRIYYGTRKGSYDGIISTIGGSRITNSTGNGNYITVRIDNSVIDENMKADKREALVYPSLENTVLYYFAVTAYDSYRPETPYNHESELSGYVSARPYGGSEIR